jgi:hypothetical protein
VWVSPAIPILLVCQERPATPKCSPGCFRRRGPGSWRTPNSRRSESPDAAGRHTRHRCDHPLAAAKADLGGSR